MLNANTSTISDNDLAVSKIMIAMREVNNDEAFIESMVAMLITTLSKKNNTSVKNFIVLGDGGFVLNAPEDETLEALKKQIFETKEGEK